LLVAVGDDDDNDVLFVVMMAIRR